MTQPVDLNALIHYGVKGMRWGVRNDDQGTYRLTSSATQIESGFHPSTAKAALEVSNLIRDRYGYDIKNVKILGPGNPEYPDTLAYVVNKQAQGGTNGTVFVQAKDLTDKMKKVEEIGWMAPGTGSVKALLTHESAHSIFHADQKVRMGLIGPRVVGGEVKARDKALKAAIKTAKEDNQSVWETSGYAATAGVREELEGEMFSQYHWGSKPPRFIKVWGETLHKELGFDPTPFKEVQTR